MCYGSCRGCGDNATPMFVLIGMKEVSLPKVDLQTLEFTPMIGIVSKKYSLGSIDKWSSVQGMQIRILC